LLPTSSYLAMPPALQTAAASAQDGQLLRDFFPNPLCVRPTQQGAYLSRLIEDLKIDDFSEHKFLQVDAFEEMNLKLGPLEASMGAVTRNVLRWWAKGRPAVTGSVGYEDIGDLKFASIRLICNYEPAADVSRLGNGGANGDKIRQLRHLFRE